ncbi:MAG: transposase [Alphaproteobacteria bacterium]|nr:transposase [Alphaproteobacteria bacterium]
MEDDGHNDDHNDASSYRRIELITGTTRHRRRSDDERERIVAESFRPGANIAAVARRHGVNVGLLHYWRKRAKSSSSAVSDAPAPAFVRVAISDAVQGAPPRSAFPRMIEIETQGAIVRVPDGTDPETLALVLFALRRAP